MLYIHPFFQLVVTMLAGYVIWLGFTRFQARHLGRKRPFNWKRHVRLGLVAIPGWCLGMVGGLAMVWLKWNVIMITGLHYKTAFVMVPLMAFGLGSGLYMHRQKRNSALLALAHGLNNTVMVLLALYQAWTGVWVVKNFLS